MQDLAQSHPTLSPILDGPAEPLIQRYELAAMLCCQPEVARIVRREAGIARQADCFLVVDLDRFDGHTAKHCERFQQSVVAIGVARHFFQADIRHLKPELGWRDEVSVAQLFRHRRAVGFAEK